MCVADYWVMKIMVFAYLNINFPLDILHASTIIIIIIIIISSWTLSVSMRPQGEQEHFLLLASAVH
jgi:hypothetical protein